MAKLQITTDVLAGMSPIYNFGRLTEELLRNTFTLDTLQIKDKKGAWKAVSKDLKITKPDDLKALGYLCIVGNIEVRVPLMTVLYARGWKNAQVEGTEDQPIYKMITDEEGNTSMPSAIQVVDVEIAENRLGQKTYDYFTYQAWADAIDDVKKSKVTEGEDYKKVELESEDLSLLFGNKELMRSLKGDALTPEYQAVKESLGDTDFDDTYARKYIKVVATI